LVRILWSVFSRCISYYYFFPISLICLIRYVSVTLLALALSTITQHTIVRETICLFANNMLFSFSFSSLFLCGKILQSLLKHSVVCGSEVKESVWERVSKLGFDAWLFFLEVVQVGLVLVFNVGWPIKKVT
jgi:hypothetical protein